MKRIFDRDFRYRPSFATDVRQTFERIRREQQTEPRETGPQGEPGLKIVKLRSKARASSAE